MAGKNYYDVTEWNVGDPYKDIGWRILKADRQIPMWRRAENRGLSSTFRQGIIIFVRRW